MALMTVYHGSFQAEPMPEQKPHESPGDFGSGFYCSLIREQAERRARRYPKGTVSVYDVRLQSGLRMRDFKALSDEWLDFITASRSGKAHDYDIVIGPMADDQIYSCVADFMDGAVTREQLWALAKYRYPAYQMAFCSAAALKCLRYRCSQEIMRD